MVFKIILNNDALLPIIVLNSVKVQLTHPMKGINTSGQALDPGALPPFPPQGKGYITLLSLHSLGRRTIMMVPFLSLRWGMKYRGLEAQLTKIII